MRRIKLSEIHEQAWFPKIFRDGVMDALQAVFRIGKIYEPVTARLLSALKASGAHRLIDLCSGAGGPWISLHRTLARESTDRFEICLTDKYPNIAAFRGARVASRGAISYCAESVDATRIPPQLGGFRVMFTSFHHFAPNQAAAILQNTIDSRQGIAIFEAARCRPLSILLTFLMPLGVFFTVPFIRPFRLSRLIWTYLIPVIPFVLWFDGVLSCLRAYSAAELSQLIPRLRGNDYKLGNRRSDREASSRNIHARLSTPAEHQSGAGGRPTIRWHRHLVSLCLPGCLSTLRSALSTARPSLP